jgi:hypothetical protein
VEDEARAARRRSVDLFVDRRNYRAYHFYRRLGFHVTRDRRFIFDVPRFVSAPPAAFATLPRHALAAALGTVATPGRQMGAGSVALQSGGLATLSVAAPVGNDAIDAALRHVFRTTLARAVRVSVPFDCNVPNGRLIAVLHRMEKVLV